ncbi:alpha/beta hydrolase [uncultured Tateyamaria sp.]|uniref:alpha/beta fold hydrolase n=1 Tax=Tateyamaria sp. 1078 TaxID=3417464 RepID=UPI002610AA3D|nr:alpha/beta hydrolase [uncultured Tateyamaria sp.]
MSSSDPKYHGGVGAGPHSDVADIAHDVIGSGPPVLLLHGFPQTRAMWHAIAPRIAEAFTVVTADLRGYGHSHRPADMEEMSFRAMAADQVALMRRLGFDRFHVVGHDRGGRTAHRMALDSPDALLSMTVMDIVPTQFLLTRMTHEIARAYYHWLFLAQPEPLPETLINRDPVAYFEGILTGIGGDGAQFDPRAMEAYRTAWRNPDVVRCMCNDYRAAIDVDLALDTADLHRTVDIPSLVLFGADGIMAQHFDVPGTWAPHLRDMHSQAIPGGHFFPDTHPGATTQALLDFLGAQAQIAP